MGRRRAIGLPAVTVLSIALAGCAGGAPGTASASPSGDIAWGSCASWLAEIDRYAEFSGVGDVPQELADRFECATVDVPLDYEDPDGRTITLAVSRLLPSEKGERTVFTNPGGPGLAGRAMPILIAKSGIADLTKDTTIVGIDVGGTGDSTTVLCDELAGADESSAAIAAANAVCVERDPEFFAQLTTQNVARDLERVREAMSIPVVDYYGASWGTELGVAYMDAFPASLGRVLLDSMTDIRQSAEESLSDVVGAAIAFGGVDGAPEASDAPLQGGAP